MAAQDQMNPDENKRWMAELRTVFIKHMGGDVVDASKLRSDYRGG